MAKVKYKRVLVTGVGPVTAIGSGASEFSAAIQQCRCGLRLLDRFDSSFSSCNLAGLVDLNANGIPRIERMAFLAGAFALEDSGLDPGAVDPWRGAVSLSSSKGGMELFNGHPLICEDWMAQFESWHPGARLRDSLGWRGGAVNFALACATGAYSIGHLAERIARGELDVGVAGAVEASVTPLIWAGFSKMGALADCGSNFADYRGPFDTGANGFVPGEGGAALVLESEEHALSRGVRGAPCLSGWSTAGDGYHMTSPRPGGEGAARCLSQSLAKAGMNPGDLEYLNAHGTGTQAGDLAECMALESVFGTLERPLPVSSTKGSTGHLLGAAGAVEAVVAVLALRDGYLPGGIGVNKAREVKGVQWVIGQSPKKSIKSAASLNMGFGGHNVALVFSK